MPEPVLPLELCDEDVVVFQDRGERPRESLVHTPGSHLRIALNKPENCYNTKLDESFLSNLKPN